MFKIKSSVRRRNEWFRRLPSLNRKKEFIEWSWVLVKGTENDVDFTSKPMTQIMLTEKEVEVANNFLKGNPEDQIYIKENVFKMGQRKRKLI